MSAHVMSEREKAQLTNNGQCWVCMGFLRNSRCDFCASITDEQRADLANHPIHDS